MKTSYYTFTTWNEGAMASGFDGAAVETRQCLMVREPEQKGRSLGGDNVIDLTAWRATNPLEQAQDEPECADLDWSEEALEEPELVQEPVRRARRNHDVAFAAELAATLSVVAAAVMLMIRIVLF